MQSPVSISLQRTVREVYEHLRANCTMFQKTDQKKKKPSQMRGITVNILANIIAKN